MSRAAPAKSAQDLLSVSFNQDGSCLSVGTRRGYSIANVEPFGKVYSKADGPCSIVEMLFCTSLVAVVGTADSQPSSSPRKLKIINTKRQSTICELVFPTAVLGVKLNRRRLVVILEEEIYIYDISNMKLLHTIETSPNPNAICALTPSSDPCYLAYPSPVASPKSPFATGASNQASPGDVMVFDLLSLSVTNIIQAHKTPISCLTLNSTGTLLATASDKGTVIRIFSVPSAQKLYQFRRGSYAARIYSISFNAVSSLLAVSSASETVHIFKLPHSSNAPGGPGGDLGSRIAGGSPGLSSVDGASDPGSPPGNGRSGAGGYEAFIDDRKRAGGLKGTLRKRSAAFGRSVSGSVGGYLPSTLAEMWEPSRDFAFFKLPSPGVSSVVAISNTTPQIMCATSEGLFYFYNIDLESGGECHLMKRESQELQLRKQHSADTIDLSPEYSLLEGDDDEGQQGAAGR